MENRSSLFRCDSCGQLFPKEELRQCKKCRSVLCPACRKNHDCKSWARASPVLETTDNQNQSQTAPPAASDPANPWSKYRYSDSGLWIFPPSSMYLKSHRENKPQANQTTVTAAPPRPKNTAIAKTSFDIDIKNFAEIFEISDTAALLDTDITLEHETALYLIQDDTVILTLEPGAHASSQIVEIKVRNHEFDPDIYTEVCLTRSIPVKIPYNIIIPQKSVNPSIIYRVKGIASISIANPIVVKREYLTNHSFILIDIIQKETLEDIEKSINEIAMEFTLEKLQSSEISMPDLSQQLTQKYSVTLGNNIDARAEVRGLKVLVSGVEIELTSEALAGIAAKKTSNMGQNAEDTEFAYDDPTHWEMMDEIAPTDGKE